MLPAKNYKRAFEFVKVIIQNIVSFFHLGYSKNAIFNDVIVTATLRSEKYILKANFTFLIKCIIGIMCAKNSKNMFKFLKVIQGRLVFFLDTVYMYVCFYLVMN